MDLVTRLGPPRTSDSSSTWLVRPSLDDRHLRSLISYSSVEFSLLVLLIVRFANELEGASASGFAWAAIGLTPRVTVEG
jgi:hypothetical protein